PQRPAHAHAGPSQQESGAHAQVERRARTLQTNRLGWVIATSQRGDEAHRSASRRAVVRKAVNQSFDAFPAQPFGENSVPSSLKGLIAMFIRSFLAIAV